MRVDSLSFLLVQNICVRRNRKGPSRVEDYSLCSSVLSRRAVRTTHGKVGSSSHARSRVPCACCRGGGADGQPRTRFHHHPEGKRLLSLETIRYSIESQIFVRNGTVVALGQTCPFSSERLSLVLEYVYKTFYHGTQRGGRTHARHFFNLWVFQIKERYL